MAQKCRTCNHPEREQIEVALANTRARVAGGINGVVKKWGIPRSSLRRHLNEHMTQEKCARLLLGLPDAIDANIEEIIRREGEGAILVLRKLKIGHESAIERWRSLGLHDEARKEGIELRKVAQLLAQYAGMVPGRKTVNNNSLVISDGTVLFEMFQRVLDKSETIQQARLSFSNELQVMAKARLPALEHVPA